MDLDQRLNQLEAVRDWNAVVAELERSIEATPAGGDKAALHARLAGVLQHKLLKPLKALGHLEAALALEPTLVEAAASARDITSQFGMADRLCKLLEADVSVRPDGPEAVARFIELADAYGLTGDADSAAASYARALGASGGDDESARRGLQDTQLDVDVWEDHLAAVLRDAGAIVDGPSRAIALLRAVRIAVRFATGEVESLLAKAYESDPTTAPAGAHFERLLVLDAREEELEALQAKLLAARSGAARAGLARIFGTRWALRHHDADRGARLLEQAFRLDPSCSDAFAYLAETWGASEGNWKRVVELAESAGDGADSFVVGVAAEAAWRKLGDRSLAKEWMGKLAASAPDHPLVLAFAREPDAPSAPAADPPSAQIAAAMSEPVTPPASVSFVTPEPASSSSPLAAPAAARVVPPPTPSSPGAMAPPAAARVVPPPTPSSASAAAAPAPRSGPLSPEKVAELVAKAEKQEQAKRYNEYVKTLVELAEAVPNDEERIQYYTKAGELFSTKFANVAEAVKCFEAVLGLDPRNAPAVDFLKTSYEKRRDWEKLVGLLKREAEDLPPSSARGAKFLEIAKLATDKVKKPEVCVDLWNEVISDDPNNAEALTALAGLHERAKDWRALAAVLQQQVDASSDDKAREALLVKLAQLYGERLTDEDASVAAWQRVLEINPQERRAQEALKKKYLALGRWDDLEVFYADAGKWDEFIRLLETQEAKETDEAAKIALLMKTAQLWAEQKQKLDRAARAYERVLTISATHLGAAERLAPVYAQANNYKGLASVLEVKLQNADDLDAKLELLRQLSDLYESKLKDLPRAFERRSTALTLAPSDEVAIAEVERLAGATSQWSNLVEVYESSIRALESEGQTNAALALRLRLGRVHLEERKNVEDALLQYRAVYDADGQNLTALRALERLYREASRYQDLLAIYEQKRDLTTDDAERRQTMLAIASLYERELGDAKSAIVALNHVLDDDALEPAALSGLDRLYREQGDWVAYADVLRKRLEAPVDNATLIDVKQRLGETLETRLSDSVSALDCYREVLGLDAANAPARQALERLLQVTSLRAEAAAILQEIYEAQSEWSKLVATLEILAEEQLDVTQRVALLRKIARLSADPIGEPARAFQAQARALREDSANAEARSELVAFAVAASVWDDLDAVFASIADGLSDAELARDYWMTLGALHDGREHVERAAASYEKVLAIDPADANALVALESLYGRAGRYADVVEIYRRKIDNAATAEAREALQLQLAVVYDDRLGRPDEAIAAYREVLASDDSNPAALKALDGLFSRREMWAELSENVEAQLRLAASEEEQRALLLRLASLRETKLHMVEAAIDDYRQVLDADVSNAEALASLQRLGALAEHEVAIADILEPIYRQTGNVERLIGVYEVQVRHCLDPIRKVELLQQIAELYEDAAADTGHAFDAHARALEFDPTSESIQETLLRLARATDRFADYVAVLDQLARRQEDPLAKCALLSVAARIQEDELRDTEAAIATLRGVLAIDPQHLPSAEALERIFRETGRRADLAQALLAKAEILDGVDDKKQALFQAAVIEEETLGRPDAAISVYRRILEVDGDDMLALDSIIRLLVGLSRWPELLVAYAKKADLVDDTRDKKAIYYQIGAVYEHELSDVHQAIDTYQRVLEIDPDDLQALGRLDVLYQSAQAWTELLGVLQREAELAEDAAEATSYQYRVADIYEKQLDDVSRAVELYREVLIQAPDHAPTIEALEKLKAGSKDPVGAAVVLEPIYSAAGEWGKLISVLEVQVAASDDVFAKVDLLHRVAGLHEEMLNDHAAAFETMARAVAFDVSREESVAALERLAMIVAKWGEVVALYDAELGKLRDDASRFVDLSLRTADICETRLSDAKGATRRLEAALVAEPDSVAILAGLDRLYALGSRWPELARTLAREAELAQNPDEALDFRVRLASILQRHLGDAAGAVAAYRDVMAAAPERTDALEALEAMLSSGVMPFEISEILNPIYQSIGDWEKLLGLYEVDLGQLADAGERLALRYRMAEICEEQLVAPERALEIFVSAIKESPTDERSLEDLERLAPLVESGWETLANAYADVLGLEAAQSAQGLIGKRLARVFEIELGDVTNALDTYRYVIAAVPGDIEALNELDRLYTSLGQYTELAPILEQRALVVSEPYELVDLYLRLGQVYEEQIEAPEQAVPAFKRVFDSLDPSNEVASAALERIYEGLGAWPELLAVFDRQLANSPPNEADVRARMARVLSDHLSDAPRAIEAWKQVLDLRGEDGEALGALASLYERLAQWGELCDVLERHYDAATDDAERVAVLLRRAQLFDAQLGRTESALDDYARALDIDYANLDALYAVADIHRRAQNATELAAAIRQTIERASDVLPPEHLSALHRELGTLSEGVLSDPSGAIDAWRNVLALEPHDFEAMQALESLLRLEARYAEVVDLKMSRAELLEDPAARLQEYLEVGSLCAIELGDKDRGTTAYEKAFELDPNNDETFKALEALHNAARRSEPLIEMYLARLDSRESASEKTAILRKVARVFDEQLEDRSQAFDALLTAFELDFDDRDTVRYLERMAQATNRWPELVQTVNDWLEQQTLPLPKIALMLRLAKWYAEDLGHPEYAQPYYQQVLALDPNNVAVLRQMASYLKKNGQWQQQGSTLTSALNVAVNDVDRKEILSDLGELLERQMNDVEQALTYYKRSLDVDPMHGPALDALERIYTARNNSADLVDILARQARIAGDPERVSVVKLRTAGIYESALGQVETAGKLFREVLDVDASNFAAMRGLERVYTATQQWPDLVAVLEMQLDVVTTERERIEVLTKLADIQETHFLKPDLAAVRLEQVVEIDPNREPALEALSRCYRRLRQWHDLVNTYDRHVAATLDRPRKLGLLASTAAVYAEELQDLDRAIDINLSITDLDANNVAALDALAKLYEKQDNPSAAIEYMTRVADLTMDGRQRVDMYYRIGRQLDEKLGDRSRAEERFEMVLDLEPAHLPTLAALRAIALDATDWDRAARLLDTEQRNTELPRARARLLVELGTLRDQMLGDRAQAVLAWEQALASDPDNEDAAIPLTREFVAAEQWSRAEPLAEMLARKSSKRDRVEQLELHKQHGKVLGALGKHEAALRAYQTANQIDVTDHEAIRGLGDACFALGDWAGALTSYQKQLTSLSDEFIAERAEVYSKIGSVKRAQGQAAQAISNFEKALAIDPSHRPTLDAIVATFESVSDFAQACNYKRQILESVLDGPERARLLRELGDSWAEKASDPEQAVVAFEEALGLEPQSYVVMHKLLNLYQQVGRWPDAVETIQRIAELESNPDRKSRYLYTMAQIHRDKLDDQARAVDLFNEALDLNPTFLEAFERINKIFTSQKDWKQLERAYRKMLHRVMGKGNTDLEFRLLHALGIIYRDRLQDAKSAIATFKLASQTKPDETQEHQILIELYEQAGQADEAIEAINRMLKLDAMNIELYRKLYSLHLGKKEYDRAWCVASALVFLRKADEEEQRFVNDYKQVGVPAPKSRLENEQWKLLFHPDQNLYVGKIFEMIAGAALKAKVELLKARNESPVLDPRHRQDPATSTVTFARTFGWAAHILGVGAPALYVRTDVPGALGAVAAEPPASVAGQSVLSGFTAQDLAFVCGKHLALYRGEHFIKTLFPTVSELTVMLYAGIKLVAPDTPVPPETEKQVAVTVQTLRGYMQPMQLENLRIVVKKFVEEGAKVNIKRWLQCVDSTASRAGLLLSGDLDVAKKIIAAEPQQAGDLSPQDKLKELIVFSVSDTYGALRQALGITISIS